jgi:hypothetical protein
LEGGRGKTAEEQAAFPAQAILMLSVALDEIRSVEGEPDLASVGSHLPH